MRKICLFSGLLALALAACGQAGTSAPPATSIPTAIVEQPTTAPTATAAPTSEPPATAQPEATVAPTLDATPSGPVGHGPGTGASVAPPPQLVSAAQQQLAKQLKVRAADLPLQSANMKQWPDGSLGCPEPGKAYPQIVMSGFLLIFTNPAQSVQHEIHTGTSAEQMILCENQQPIDLSIRQVAAPTAAPAAAPAPDETGKRMGELSQAALARDQGLSTADVTVVAVEEATWNDSSLGCPQPGQNYLQVITPGYKITLEAQGKRYEYHADRNRRVVRCDQR